jgi:hypothetical protein
VVVVSSGGKRTEKYYGEQSAERLETIVRRVIGRPDGTSSTPRPEKHR